MDRPRKINCDSRIRRTSKIPSESEIGSFVRKKSLTRIAQRNSFLDCPRFVYQHDLDDAEFSHNTLRHQKSSKAGWIEDMMAQATNSSASAQTVPT